MDAQTQTVETFEKKSDASVTETSNSSKPKQQTSSQVKPNTPHYQNSNKSNVSIKQSRRVSQTTKQKIDLNHDRVKKGSNDPIQNHNRFEVLNEDMEDDGDHIPDFPPPPVSKEGKITRISPP